MTRLNLLSTLAATVLLTAGCATLPHPALAKGKAAVASAIVNPPPQETWQQLKFDCKAPRDPAIEAIMDADDLIAEDGGKKSYCVATIPTGTLPAMDLDAVLFVETGELAPANCGGDGCNVLFLGRKQGRLVDVSIADYAVMMGEGQQVFYSAANGSLGIAFKDPACNAEHPCKAGDATSAIGNGVEVNAYNPNTRRFFRYNPQ